MLKRFSTYSGRLRARVYRFLGGDIDRNVTIGSGSVIDHPSRVKIGCYSTLERGVWLKLESDNAHIQIGDHSFLGRGSQLDVTQRVTIGHGCLIAPGVFITDHNHNIAAGIPIRLQGCQSAEVTIGDDVWIGAHAVILPGITIEDGVVIGAGAVVTKSVTANEVWGGVPARKLRDRK